MPKNIHDHPFLQVCADMDRLARAGGFCFQKFTCAKCGARQCMPVPNVAYKTGTCEECGHLTNIVESGCNFRLVGLLTPELMAAYDAMGAPERPDKSTIN